MAGTAKSASKSPPPGVSSPENLVCPIEGLFTSNSANPASFGEGGERWVTGTEIGVGGIWIVRGNDGEKSGSSATLGVVSALVRVVTCVLVWLVAVS